MKKQNNRISFPAQGISILLVLLMMAGFLNAQGQTTLSLTETINQVLADNPNLASAEANLEATRSNIAIARGKYLPGINLLGSISQSKAATFSQTAGVIPSSSAILGASLSQMVYNEQTLANHKIQQYLFASAEEQLRNTRYHTISAAGLSYIGLLFADDLLAVQQQNMQITDQNLDAANDRLDVGSADVQEVLRWETQKYANLQAVESQKAAVIVSRGGLNQLLNLPIETRQSPEELTTEKDAFIFSSNIVAASIKNEDKARILRDFLVELGLANSAVIASIDQQLLATGRLYKANKRWAIPSFSASAGANAKFDLAKEDPETDEDIGFWKFGMSMYWPIVDGGSNINKAKQSRYQMSALELQKHDIQTSLEQAIRASVAVVISDFLNISYAQAQAKAAQKNFELVYDSYLFGESSQLDLLDAQTTKLSADISARIAHYTFFMDLLSVEQAIGYFPFLEPDETNREIITELERRLLQSQ